MKPQFKKRIGAGWKVLLLGAISFVAVTQSAQEKMGVGINLDGVTYYNTSRPFVDVFKLSSTWLTSDVSKNDWDSGQEAYIPTDGNGWPTRVPFTANFAEHYVHTQMPAYLNGTYTIKTVGQGTFAVKTGPTETTYTANGGNSTFTINVSNANLGRGEPSYLYLKITRSPSSDPLRNIQVLLPGYGSSTATFDPKFKSLLSPFSTIRFMDWGNTNRSPNRDWANRTLLTDYTQASDHGVALEYMVRLCNETNKDMWICVPHQATDDYVRQMATLIKNSLSTSRKVYIEYSNEVWNSQFQDYGGYSGQFTWVNKNVAGGGTTMEKYGRRARQVFDIFSSAFGSNTRLVRVLAGQAANSDTLNQANNGAGGVCDAFAIAPYFGHALSPTDVSTYGIPSLDSLINDDRWNWKTNVQNWLTSSKTFANSKGKRLVCYEGGQHYVGYLGAENNDALTNQLITLNRNYRMRDYYRYTYLPMVNNSGVDLFCSFSLCASQSKWGSWGMMEYIDQTVNDWDNNAVKLWAVQQWIANG